MKIINLNDKISVELTAAGAEALNKYDECLKKLVPRYQFLEHSKGDIWNGSLWELIDAFHDNIFITSNILPFKNNEIMIFEEGDKFE